MVSTTIVSVPGFGGSDSSHWQTLWEAHLGQAAVRIEPRSWIAPDEGDWLDALSAVVRPGSVLVAHGLGCLAVAAWLAHNRDDARVVGAVLVAPPDRHQAGFPLAPDVFAEHGPLPVRSLVIASTDDPWATPSATYDLVARWGSTLVEIEDAGHLNADSGLGEWELGRGMVTGFCAGLGAGPPMR